MSRVALMSSLPLALLFASLCAPASMAGVDGRLTSALGGPDPIATLRAVSERQLDRPIEITHHAARLSLMDGASELLSRAGADRPAAVASLAALDAGTQARLARVFDAFLRFDTANRLHLAGGDVAQVFEARLVLLQATLAFPGENAPITVDAAPAFILDLSGEDSTYRADAAFTIDVGGDDLYLNRAGGGGVIVSTLCPFTQIQPSQAGRLLPTGFLADYGGDDRYLSGYDCGTNGGAFQGAGFLYDAEGNDEYLAGQGGVNGGAFFGGVGFLQDDEGHDAYRARPEHTTYGYGANGAGSFAGYGTLVDRGGHDTYHAGQEGANGGGYALGEGALVDQGGNDLYEAGALGTNGAAYNGEGLLWDASGDDIYLASQEWGNSNGEGWQLDPSVRLSACLFDGEGHDWYDDNQGARGWDLTLHPKGMGGSQFDGDGSATDCPSTS